MASDGYLLGFDLGSSSIKASLIDAATGKLAGSAASPKHELAIDAPRPGWAEQDPAVWWENIVAAAAELKAATGRSFDAVKGIGISYQMHGLVLLDDAGAVLRPSIIWCDSRAVQIGERAFHGIGESTCLARLLNSPGNFTASKLAWVKENEPRVFSQARCMLLPGDWLAFRMTGEKATTESGLSEGILWDFSQGSRADMVLDWYGIPRGSGATDGAHLFTAGRAHRRSGGGPGAAEGNARLLSGGRSAEQRLLPQCARSRRSGGNGRHLGGGLRHHRCGPVRSRVPGQRIRPRESFTAEAALRRPDVRERDGHPLQLAAQAAGRRDGARALR